MKRVVHIIIGIFPLIVDVVAGIRFIGMRFYHDRDLSMKQRREKRLMEKFLDQAYYCSDTMKKIR